MPQRHYPWGNDPDSTRVNYNESHIGHPNALGCFPKGKSPYGCQEMSGNVLEWAQSLYEKYEDSPKKEHERLDEHDPCVIKAGSYYRNKFDITLFYRDWYNPSSRGNGLGFRVFRLA